VYDQDAVRDAVLSAGRRVGKLNLTCGITEQQASVQITIRDTSAFFTPAETRSLLADLIDVADVEGWLHEPSTLHAIARLRDFADVVDNTHPKTLTEVEQKWRKFNERVYDFESDPLELKTAIQDIREEYR